MFVSADTKLEVASDYDVREP